MNAALKTSCLVGMGIFVVFSERPAHAAEGPLLVVVEAPPALDADAAEIRRAIGVELRAQTIAPLKRSAESPGRALIIAFDHDRIAMSLRTNDATPIVRDIPTPTDRAARLRAIAWLAGNLARDQVSPIVEQAPIEMPSLATIPPREKPGAAAEPSVQASVPLPPTEPPPATGLANVISVRPNDVRPSSAPRWSIGIADGATTYFPVSTGGPNDSGSAGSPYSPELWNPFRAGLRSGLRGSAWRIELQRRTKRDGRFWGAALGGTAGSFAPQLIGATALLGSAKHWGRWSFEPTIDAGLELSKLMETTFSLSSVSGVTQTYSSAIHPALCADGAIAVAHPVSESFDAVLRLGVHATTAQFDNWFLSATLGLRYNLQ